MTCGCEGLPNIKYQARTTKSYPKIDMQPMATSEIPKYVEGVRESETELLAWWHTQAGKRVFQSWKARSRLSPDRTGFEPWDEARVHFWEIERPFILTGVDPLALIDWAKKQGIYEFNSGEKGLLPSVKYHTLQTGVCEVPSPDYTNLLSYFDTPLPFDLRPDYLPDIEYMPATIPSPEEARVAREAKVNEVLKRLREGIEKITDSRDFREYLITASKFWDYSFGNQMLIMIQKPGASKVMGFNQWKEVGRFVKKGEKGISILAPCGAPTTRRSIFDPYRGQGWLEIDSIPGWQQSELRRLSEKELKSLKIQVEGGRFMAEQIPFALVNSFMVVYVFDISQTEGKPIPEFKVVSLSGTANQALFNRTIEVAKGEGLAVSFESKPGQDPGIKGYYQERGKVIWIRPEEPEAMQEKTLFHELAHYWTLDVMHIPRADAETIAESSAFVVAAHYGFDTGVYSFPYVAIWARDRKVLDKNIKSIMEVVRKMLEKFGEITGQPMVESVERPFEPYKANMLPQVSTTVITSSDDIGQLYRQGFLTKHEVIRMLIYLDRVKKPFTVQEWEQMRKTKAREHGKTQYPKLQTEPVGKPGGIDYLSDSPEFLAETVSVYQDNIEAAFKEAMDRVRSE